MASNSPVVVWCYLSHRVWTPFEPLVSNHIEKANVMFENGQSSSPTVNICHLSPQFFDSEIDLRRQVLRIRWEGVEDSIERRVCPPGSIYFDNVIWEFEGNFHPTLWVPFDFDTAQIIEDAVQYRGKGKDKTNGCSKLSLMEKTGLPYIINLKKKVQTNIITGKERKIRRTILTEGYVCDTADSTTGAGMMTRKRKNVACSLTVPNSVKGAKSGADKPNITNKVQGQTVTLPKEMTLILGRYEGANSDNVGEFMMKYTRQLKRSNKRIKEDCYNGCNNSGDSDREVQEDDENDLGDDDSGDEDNGHKTEKYNGDTGNNEYEQENDDKNEIEGDKENGGNGQGKEEEECAICFDKLSGPSGYGEDKYDSKDTSELIKCHHIFHKLCLMQMYKSCGKDGYLECPSCKHVHGDKVGNCPAGQMNWSYRKDLTLPGHEDCRGTLEVTYMITSGIQVQGHPNPGKPFNARGFPRRGYIPDSNKGRKVLKLLMEAFRRRLMFTIGTSVTTGESDTVTWNDIHHKTEAMSNHSGHGYPDPNYLDNVLSELMAQGVTEDCLTD